MVIGEAYQRDLRIDSGFIMYGLVPAEERRMKMRLSARITSRQILMRIPASKKMSFEMQLTRLAVVQPA